MGNDRLRVRLRAAERGDRLCLWRWRNENGVRETSFNSKKIPYEIHKTWFAKRLAQPQTKILIGESGLKAPIGQVRFDRLGKEKAEVHILLKKTARNKGYGSVLLREACRYGFRKLKLREIVARILSDNTCSIRVFEKAGFRQTKSFRKKNRSALVMKLSPSELK